MFVCFSFQEELRCFETRMGRGWNIDESLEDMEDL